MSHDLILFDLDGTLSDPAVGIGRSINFALERHGFAPLAEGEVSPYIGPPLDEGFRAMTGRDDDATIRSLIAAYRERYGDIGYAENTLYDGIPQALQALCDAGLPLGLCTSKRRDFACKILALFGLDGLFRFVSGGEIGLQKWQQIATLREQGRVGSGAVMVGDRAVDMIAAHRNGLAAAGVLWGHGSLDELRAEAPRYLIDRPAELARWCVLPGPWSPA
ncbi:HAD hydrolase-like protein [Ideonella sp. YS5]|uniref:HAD hydrolase-like protein n=1 Tax=Ideonella sp. YS5 TaxID=3453714 RepID=UPI003EE9B9B3